ncbi:MAG: hypothetical protein J1F35_04435 [Erysipelotrichales bacterium]|nr:hypothetical protein [Erysipelotrichales bacterium]
MNCRNCGVPLIGNNPICQNCGLDNSQNPVIEQASADYETLTDDFIELDDNDEKIEITENMAPPTLEVEKENLSAGTTDISNAEEVSTYSPEEEIEQANVENQSNEEEKVDFAIPSVQTPVTDVAMPKDGSAPEVSTVQSTVGISEENVQALENLDNAKSKKFKIKLSKGSKNVPKNLMIIVGITFLVVGIMLGKMFFSKNYCTVPSTSVVSSKKKFVNDGKNNVTNIGSFTYTIPNDYIYDKNDNGVLIYNKDDTFRIYITSEKGSYEDISGAKNSIRESLKENSYTVNSVKEIKSLDIDFVVFETTTNLVNRMVAFADAGEGYIYYLEIVNINNTFDYEVLEIAADIVKNVTYEEVSTKMESIGVNNVSDISIKAAQEYKSLIVNK